MVEREEYALVTGGNRGLGLEICRQFAAQGFVVIIGSRSEKRGIEAVEKLRESGFSNVIFHQLDVTDAASVAAAADFVKTNFGKLDFLVNNARNRGVEVEGDVAVLEEALAAAGEVKLMISPFMQPEPFHPRASGKLVYSYELVKESIEVNYYGPKRTTEAFAPLLHKSDRPKIWNVPSTIGSLHAINSSTFITSNLCKLLRNEWAKEVLANELSLTEAMIDEVVEKFAEDFKQGKVEENKWPAEFAAYKVSKAAMYAYTGVALKKYPCITMLVLRPGLSRTGTTFYSEHQVKMMALVRESEGLSASLFRRWESFRSLVDRTVMVCLRR